MVISLGATGIFAYNLFFFNGLTLIEASRAALIIALNPVAITLCSALVYREPLPLSRIARAVPTVPAPINPSFTIS